MEELLKLRSEVEELESNMRFYNNLAYDYYTTILRQKEKQLLELELLNLFKGGLVW